jgi:diguanylate cyclase (GGDEF)-like protein
MRSPETVDTALARADAETALRMMGVLLPLASVLAVLTFVSSLLGYGNYPGWAWPLVHAVLVVGCQAWWPLADDRTRRGFSLVLLAVLVLQYTVGYLHAPPQEALVGILTILLFLPLVLAIVAMSGLVDIRWLVVVLAIVAGTVSIIGANRDVLADDGFDWRFGPLFAFAILLYGYYLEIWVGHRRDLVSESLTREALEVDLELTRLDAITDGLTGLPNRRGGLAVIEELVRSGTGFSALVIDVDHFKRVNDTLGHDGGDGVLREVAGVLSEHVRGDDVACRWGGEEFVAVFSSDHPETGEEVAERIRLAIRDRVRAAGRPVTVSIGVAYRAADTSAMSVLKLADEALYEAKATGRDRVVTAL